MSHLAQRYFLALVLLSNTTLIYGQENPLKSGALSYRVGETNVYPSIKIGFFQDNNAFLESDTEVVASELQISPKVTWVADRRLLSLQGSYSGLYGVNSEENLNFADHRLTFNANAELTSRKRLSGLFSLEFGNEKEGTNLTRGSGGMSPKPVQFRDFSATGFYRYGASNARGNLAGGVLIQNFDYTNRADVSANRGYTLFEPFGEFSLRLSGDTRLLSELRYGMLRFENSQRDRDDLSLFGGMQFAATGKSGGAVRIGILQSQPKLSSLDAQTEFVLRASVFWEPTSFARLDLDVKRALDNRGNSFVKVDGVSAVEDLVTLRWRHSWSSRLSHVSILQTRNTARVCPDLDFNNLSFSIELNVQLRRWISAGVSGSSSARDVAACAGVENLDPNFDFEQTRIGVHLRATL